jgi:lipopolysaccharide transport system ATP-binding protein
MSTSHPMAISIEQLGKQYRLGSNHGAYRTLRETITDFLQTTFKGLRPIRPPRAPSSPAHGSESLWALKEVSLEIPQGEILGIIGRNGAGKTTLLKVLSRITEPTEGRVKLRGRIGSLLEVGTGFHPELTGRENIFMNGAILGMSRREIQRKFDEIVAFAEIEPFLDTPLKRYSTGMGTRLAFSVAAHLETDILLVDEVLAVGDFSFQKKCIGKMGDVARLGRTVLFVSHNMGAIANLCKRAIWLDTGRIMADGPTDGVVNKYQSKYLNISPEWQRPVSWQTGNDLMFLKISATNKQSGPPGVLNIDEPILITISYSVMRNLPACQVRVCVYNSENVAVFTTSDTDIFGVPGIEKDSGFYHTSFEIPAYFLRPGTYYLQLAAHSPRKMYHEIVEEAITFEISVVNALTALDGRLGIVSPLLRWKTIKE